MVGWMNVLHLIRHFYGPSLETSQQFWKFPLSKNPLYQLWLEIVQWSWRKSLQTDRRTNEHKASTNRTIYCLVNSNKKIASFLWFYMVYFSYFRGRGGADLNHSVSKYVASVSLFSGSGLWLSANQRLAYGWLISVEWEGFQFPKVPKR
jgi:hypothetical protein